MPATFSDKNVYQTER